MIEILFCLGFGYSVFDFWKTKTPSSADLDFAVAGRVEELYFLTAKETSPELPGLNLALRKENFIALP